MTRPRLRLEPEVADGRDNTPGAPTRLPADALAASRVDLLAIIDAGIPEREWVPGSPIFLRGRRYLLPGAAGSCKSLAALTMGVDVAAAGGTVWIIDVENGGDEYARRLADVLADRPAEVRDAVRERLRYFAYPSLSLAWSPDDWAAAVAGADLFIFDSSRLALSSVGLAEDKADDYAAFVAALIMPLARARIATAVLDNTGWQDGDRARGSSAKRDLCEVEYTVKRHGRVDLDHTGEVEFTLTRSRFPEQPPRLVMAAGGGTYAQLVPKDVEPGTAWRPTVLIGRLIETAKASPGIGRSDLVVMTKGKNETLREALAFALQDGFLEPRTEGRKEGIWWVRDLEPDADGPWSSNGPGPVPDRADEERSLVPVSIDGTGDHDEGDEDREGGGDR